MSVEYTPRHKKPPSWAGSTPRGPERWARAYANAMRHPNSKHAQLLFDRIGFAHMLRKHYSDAGPSEHLHGETGKRLYVTCSLFCTAMTVQLDHGIKSYVELVNFLADDPRTQPLDRTTLRRPGATCYTCGTSIKKGRAKSR